MYLFKIFVCAWMCVCVYVNVCHLYSQAEEARKGSGVTGTC